MTTSAELTVTDATVPGIDASVPDIDASAPDIDASAPDIDASVPGIIAVASVATDKPGRYAKQLVAHLGRKLTFTWSDGIASAPIAEGTGSLTAGGGVLTLGAPARDPGAPTVLPDVLGRHLERFGQRDGLVVTWNEALG